MSPASLGGDELDHRNSEGRLTRLTRISQQAQLSGKEEALRCSLLYTADLRERRQGGEL